MPCMSIILLEDPISQFRQQNIIIKEVYGVLATFQVTE